MGRKYGIAAMSIQTASRPSQSAHGRRDEADSQHAAKKPGSGHYRAVVPPAGKRLQSLCGKPVPGNEAGRLDLLQRRQEEWKMVSHAFKLIDLKLDFSLKLSLIFAF